jgi:hypothetical protein
VTADFSGGEVTSDAGVLVSREIAEQTGFIDRFAGAIADTRHQSYVSAV